MADTKVSQFSNKSSVALTDYVLGNDATGPTTITWLWSVVLKFVRTAAMQAKSGAYTVIATDDFIGVTTTSTVTITLPLASSMLGRQVIIKDVSGSAGTNNITIARTSSDTLDGATSKTINTNFGSLTFLANVSGSWVIV